MSSRTRQLEDSEYEEEIRTQARAEAVRALESYHSPLNRNVTPAELATLRSSDTSEAAGDPAELTAPKAPEAA